MGDDGHLVVLELKEDRIRCVCIESKEKQNQALRLDNNPYDIPALKDDDSK